MKVARATESRASPSYWGVVKMEATLVLESRGFAPQLRSAPFSAGWSRLYQAENYVLDLSCKVQDKHSSLQGHIMLDSNPEIPVGSVTLLHADEELACATLDAFGQFQINMRQVRPFSFARGCHQSEL